nr:MAG: hypothetical protein [Trichoderma spirale orphan RNA]
MLFEIPSPPLGRLVNLSSFELSVSAASSAYDGRRSAHLRIRLEKRIFSGVLLLWDKRELTKVENRRQIVREFLGLEWSPKSGEV